MNTQVTQQNNFAIPTNVDWRDASQCSAGVDTLVTSACEAAVNAHEAIALACIGVAIHIHLHGDNSSLVHLMNGLPATQDKLAIGEFFVHTAKCLISCDEDKLVNKAALFEQTDFPVLPQAERHQDLLDSEDEAVKALALAITGFRLDAIEKPKTVNIPEWKKIMLSELKKQIRLVFTRSDSEDAKPMSIGELRKHITHCIDLGCATLTEMQEFVSQVQARASKKGKLLAYDESVFGSGAPVEAGVHVGPQGQQTKVDEQDNPFTDSEGELATAS